MPWNDRIGQNCHFITLRNSAFFYFECRLPTTAKMHKIFIAQKSYCACRVLSLATVRSKYYFNFILNINMWGRELFDHPSWFKTAFCSILQQISTVNSFGRSTTAVNISYRMCCTIVCSYWLYTAEFYASYTSETAYTDYLWCHSDVGLDKGITRTQKKCSIKWAINFKWATNYKQSLIIEYDSITSSLLRGQRCQKLTS